RSTTKLPAPNRADWSAPGATRSFPATATARLKTSWSQFLAPCYQIQLVKIVRTLSDLERIRQRSDLARQNVDDVIDVLHLPFHHHPRMRQDLQPPAREQLGLDHNIRNSRIVFQAQKQNSVRRARPLPHNNVSCYPDHPAIRHRCKLRGRNNPELVHLGAAV